MTSRWRASPRVELAIVSGRAGAEGLATSTALSTATITTSMNLWRSLIYLIGRVGRRGCYLPRSSWLRVAFEEAIRELGDGGGSLRLVAVVRGGTPPRNIRARFQGNKNT